MTDMSAAIFNNMTRIVFECIDHSAPIMTYLIPRDGNRLSARNVTDILVPWNTDPVYMDALSQFRERIDRAGLKIIGYTRGFDVDMRADCIDILVMPP
jgi:hypothetical protein